MKTLEYIGKHMPQGLYEIEESKAEELLKLDVWKVPGTTKLKTEEISEKDLKKMKMQELRKFAKDKGLKSKDNDKEELVEEIVDELQHRA